MRNYRKVEARADIAADVHATVFNKQWDRVMEGEDLADAREKEKERNYFPFKRDRMFLRPAPAAHLDNLLGGSQITTIAALSQRISDLALLEPTINHILRDTQIIPDVAVKVWCKHHRPREPADCEECKNVAVALEAKKSEGERIATSHGDRSDLAPAAASAAAARADVEESANLRAFEVYKQERVADLTEFFRNNISQDKLFADITEKVAGNEEERGTWESGATFEKAAKVYINRFISSYIPNKPNVGLYKMMHVLVNKSPQWGTDDYSEEVLGFCTTTMPVAASEEEAGGAAGDGVIDPDEGGGAASDAPRLIELVGHEGHGIASELRNKVSALATPSEFCKIPQ